jgi:hypothetical protein
MNGPYFRDRFTTSDSVEKNDKDSDNPEENSDLFADKVPVDPALIHETPMGGTVAAVGPLNEPLADEVPLFETPAQEIPMGGTVAAVGPMDETFVHEAPMGEALPYKAPVSETNSDEPWVRRSIPSEDPMGAALPYKAPPVEPITDEPWVNKSIPSEDPMDEALPYKAPLVEPITVEPWVNKSIPSQAPVEVPITHEAPIAPIAGSSVALFNHEESEHLRARWNEIQGKFVDEPRTAVQQADALVSEVIEQITHIFANEHGSLEGQWKQGNDVSTEDLRKALKQYRSFFNRLVV